MFYLSLWGSSWWWNHELCNPRLLWQGTKLGTKLDPGAKFCLLSLWAFLSTALWRVSGNITLKDSRRAGDLVWLLEKTSFSGLPWPTRLIEPELVSRGADREKSRDITSSVGITQGGSYSDLFRRWWFLQMSSHIESISRKNWFQQGE